MCALRCYYAAQQLLPADARYGCGSLAAWTGTPTGLTLLFQEHHAAGALTAAHALPT
eukprot:COSAG02_NODE_23292_length_723_cov_0.988782_1_plen_56_part_10